MPASGVHRDVAVRLPGVRVDAGGAARGLAQRGGAVGGHRHVPAVPRAHRGGVQRGPRLVRLHAAARQQAPARARPHAAAGPGGREREDGAGAQPAQRRQAGQGQPRRLRPRGEEVPGPDQRGRCPTGRRQVRPHSPGGGCT